MATFTVTSPKWGWSAEFSHPEPKDVEDELWTQMVMDPKTDVSALAWHDWKVKVAPGMREQKTAEAAKAYLEAYKYGAKGGITIMDLGGVEFTAQQIAQLESTGATCTNYKLSK